jgi:hypothetical protein
MATVDMYSEYLAIGGACPQGGTLTDGYYCLINGGSPAVPGVPTFVTADGGSGSAVISWTAPNANGSATITSYTVTASPGGETCVATEGTGCTVTGLTNGSSYTFSVFATNSDGNSAASAPSNSVVPLAVPGAPTGLSATVASPTSATLTWSAPTTTGGSPIVDYTATSFLGGVTAAQTCSTTSATTCTITGLTTGDAYTFSVTARNVSGTSASSNVYPAGQDVWTESSIPTGGYEFTTGAYGNGTYVLFAYESSTAYYSTNGTTWSTTTVPGSTPIYSSVAFGNGAFIALQSGGTTELSYSTNGISWVQAPLPTAAAWSSVSFVGGEFIAQSASTAVAALSTNGLIWRTVSLPAAGSVIGVNGSGVMVGQFGDSVFYSSNNGLTWSAVTALESGPYYMSYANGEFFATVTGDTTTIWNSTNGTTWTSATLPSSQQWSGVVSANGVLIANAPGSWQTGSQVVAYSTNNGANWSQATLPETEVGELYDVAGLVVAIDTAGSSGYLSVISPVGTNGGTWLAPYMPTVYDYGNFESWGFGFVNGGQIDVIDFEGYYAAVLTDGLSIATVPSAPSTPVATATSTTTANVSWNAPSSNGSPITDYTVTASGGQTCSTLGELSCTVTGLTEGTSYTFTVKATNAVGIGAASSSSAAIIAASVPGYPTGIGATVTSPTTVAVTWIAPYSNGGAPITKYTVTASPSGMTCTTGTTSCTVTGLTSGDAYTFTVTATNASGNSVASPQFPTAANAWATTTLPASTDSTALAYGDGTFVALGKYNVQVGGGNSPYAAVSTDNGEIWVTSSGGLPWSAEWDAVTYGNGEFVAVSANDGVAAYSLDNGNSWSYATMPSSEKWDSITYGNGAFVAVAYNGEVAYSADGSNWTLASSAPSAVWSSVTYADNEFLAVAYGGTSVMYSATGVTWTSETLPASANWTSVTYGDGEFVAVAWGSNASAYSSNGVSWTLTTLPASEDWIAVSFAGNQFYAIANGNTATAISANGTSWSTGASLSTAGSWTALASSGSNLLASAYSSTTAELAPIDTNTAPTPTTLPGGDDGEVIVYGGSTFVALGDYSAVNASGSSSNTTATSTNGTTWSAGGALPASEEWDAAAYGGGTFVAVSYGGVGAYSTNNGVTWTESSLPDEEWDSVTYGDGKFVAISVNSGTAEYSTNGISWTAATLPASEDWTSVTYGNGEFVAVSWGGNEAYSANGISWTADTQIAGFGWIDVTYSGGLFLATSQTVAAYSTDGINWTTSELPVEQWWYAAVNAGGTIEFIGLSPNLALSTDGGATWTTGGLISGGLMTSAVYVNGEVVAVDGGTASYVDWNAGLVT